MRVASTRMNGLGHFDPAPIAMRWIRTFMGEGEDSLDWFFRAPALLERFPAAFLETEVPDRFAGEWLDLLPPPAPRSMPEQEIVGPIAHAVRVAREAFEGVSSPSGVERVPR